MSPLVFCFYCEVPFLKCFFQVKNKGLVFFFLNQQTVILVYALSERSNETLAMGISDEIKVATITIERCNDDLKD